MKNDALTIQNKVGKIPSRRRIAYRSSKGLFTIMTPIGFLGRIPAKMRR
jgi:hypothetical protein